jgi:hypothetical protein
MFVVSACKDEGCTGEAMSRKTYADITEIDKNLDVPPRHKTRAKWIIFDKLEVGDSVFIPDDLCPPAHFGSVVSYWNVKLRPKLLVSRSRDKTGARFEKNGRIGFRIFRVE